jgi:hypothetical protein
MRTLEQIVNADGNEHECLAVIPSPILAARPVFYMRGPNHDYYTLGYWFPELNQYVQRTSDYDPKG